MSEKTTGAPWKGKRLVAAMDDTAIADEDGDVFYATNLHPQIAPALVHRANAYEDMRERLEEATDALEIALSEMRDLSDSHPSVVKVDTALIVARRTLDALEPTR